MKITVAQTAGFCFGVSRAVNRAFKESQTREIVTYGPLTHNSHVINKLEKRNVYAVSNLDEALGKTLLIRAHGVSKAVIQETEQKGIEYIDCTCPCLKKIHSIVEKSSLKGDIIIIAGDKTHPEVYGTQGWALNGSIAINNPDEVFLHKFDVSKNYTVVAQTTIIEENFNAIIVNLRNLGLNLTVYNTICDATRKRQEEADFISKNVDIMLVLGDKKSSNTTKLYEICKKNCEKTFLLHQFEFLVLKNASENDRIGVTAGASTPPDIIKEAIEFMNEAEKNTQSFEEMLDDSLVTLRTGEVVKGTVINVTATEISVNLKYKSDGIIPKSEFTDDSNADLTALVKPGDEIEVYVTRVNDGEGNVLLSKKRLDSQKGWANIEEAFNSHTPIRGKFQDVIKGGMMASICGLRVFVPSSQVSSRYVDDLKKFKGKEADFKIIEFDKKSRRIVAGRKELAQQEEKESKDKVFASLEEGQRIKGTVSRIVEFGAFVDLGGVDGLIHISQMSWGRVRKAKDIVSEGDVVEVVVLNFDKEKSKISLSLKDVNNDPWFDATVKYQIGDIVEGKVVRMVPFGAFVELEDGVDGLVHVSQIAHTHVPKPDDVLSIGQIIRVKVTEVDIENKRISLSKKDAEPKDDEDEAEEAVADDAVELADEAVADEAGELADEAVADDAGEEASELADVAVADDASELADVAVADEAEDEAAELADDAVAESAAE
ncbi:MAG: bifunctional 4-hydroxy-3-methylbut-2-enyl diphosphate reductase/30S ribosomal protein S1 [Clostridiales bacterium]|jgi:4-hydroxy-3-methylbut-2-enyl diphosphate reductase|nr:bifunctional 4-hydroxy-3-methylbut-2-enyl diphosphate reductase/30S ribosomal protein S1 [Clostridiales bacterium]